MCAVSGCYWPLLPKQTKTKFSNPEPCNFFLRNYIIIFRHAMLCISRHPSIKVTLHLMFQVLEFLPNQHTLITEGK